MPLATLDHLVVAAANLEQGEDYVEVASSAFAPWRGGRHVAMGTHNSLLKLGAQSYLEVIAIDPDGVKAGSARAGSRSTPLQCMRRSPKRPRLIHWVARTGDIDAAKRACPIDLGPVQPMERGPRNEWRITIPGDGDLPGAGLVPTLIQWSDAARLHPADAMPDAGIRLLALAGAHPEPASIRSALATLVSGEALPVTYDPTPRLAAMLRTPRGTVTL